ncbi:TonB-dependent receptor plug domain-containing protein [Ferruginibacter sp. SUN106]|uniref:TonB-dependent receptor plug domain-containing protein n=1 Tax=Ferruginibacter sp. SUN106 TaxID=2978348 RepID=UPI003D36215F
MKRKFFIAAAVIISSTAQAQDSTKLLNEVVVETATKTPVKQSQTGKVVTVITKEQIEKSSGKTVAQILNEQAGITVNGAYNAPGSVQTIFLRGASSGRTLILLDGIPVSDPSMINNEFDLNLFSINDVERIEVCKGAQSTLYGSDAVAGVVNIITVKKDINKPFNIKATTGFGNKNTTRNNLQLYGKEGKLTYTTRFAKLKTNGFSSAYDSTGANNFDNDGYDGNVISAAVQYQVVPSLLVKTFIMHSQYKADIDAGVFADEKDYTIKNSNLSSGVGVNFKKGIVNITGNYQYGELKRTYRNDSLFVRPFGTKFESNRYGGRTQYGELFGNVTATKWLTVITGVDYRWGNMNQQYYSLSSFGPYSSNFADSALHQTSFYSSLLFTALDKKLHIEVGGRTNKHSRYGTNNTYTFNPSYSINKNWRVFGSIASGFKAPSIFQLLDKFSGNPELAPEKSTNYEFGVQQSNEKINSRVVYFHRDINNGIDYDNYHSRYFNYVKQIVDGVEIELTVEPVKNLSVSANYTLITGDEQTQSRKNTHDTTYSYLLRRPKNNFNCNIGYQFTKAIYASITGKSVSSRYDVGGYRKEDILLDSYFILSAYAEYKYSSNVKFFANGQNITNKKFFDIRGYNAMPFLINGGVTFNL